MLGRTDGRRRDPEPREIHEVDPEAGRHAPQSIHGGKHVSVRRPAGRDQRTARHERDFTRPISVCIRHANDRARTVARDPAREGELLSVGRPVGARDVTQDLVRVAAEQRHTIERGALRRRPDEENGGPVGREAREIVASRGEGKLSPARQLLQPDPRHAVAIGREGDRLAVGRRRGSTIVTRVRDRLHRGRLRDGGRGEAPMQQRAGRAGDDGNREPREHARECQPGGRWRRRRDRRGPGS